MLRSIPSTWRGSASRNLTIEMTEQMGNMEAVGMRDAERSAAAIAVSRSQVILDTDPGVDDAMALYLLARHPLIDLRAVTTVFGNASLATTTRNALALCGLYGLSMPVAAGAAGPLQALAEERFPSHVHGLDGMGGAAGLAAAAALPDSHLDARPAWQLICDQVNAAPGEITLIAVGPLTNLALALQHDPSIAGKLRQVVVMGGAFGIKGHCGNITAAAEANIYCDPQAAALVFCAPWQVVIVGLDVTQEVVMTEAYLANLQGRGGPAGDFLWQATRHYQDFYDSRDAIKGIYSHDASAVAFVIEPSAFDLRAGAVQVQLDGVARGQTTQDSQQAGQIQQVCVGVRPDQVLALFEQIFD